jgi:molybdopterin-containing oxidoreductase family iron-sulfur binding subunit
MISPEPNDFRARLASGGGPELWRSLEEFNGAPEFRGWLEREFPPGASEWPEDGLSRRHFLSLLGASLALAGLTGCSRPPDDKVVPYVEQPEQILPGKPLFYASAMPWRGFARGILVKTEMGRPVKIEGNPAHPDSLGATDPFMQAAILSLWDPERSQAPALGGEIASWDAFEAEWLSVNRSAISTGGAGLYVLTEPTTSPTLQRQMGDLLKKFPNARWHQWSPETGASLQPGPAPDFGAADLIVSVGSDFLVELPGSLRHTRQFAGRRRVRDGAARPNRLYVLESTPTLTGAMADQRLSAPPDRIAAVLRRLNGAADETLTASERDFASQLAADLALHAGRSVILSGTTEPAEIRALTVRLAGAPAVAPEPYAEDLAALTGDLDAGKVKQLFILGGNPVYTAPAALNFAAALRKAQFAVHLSLYQDETSQLCRWHLPAAHFLETWSDLLGSEDTGTILQPAISPLYRGRSSHEILALLLGESPADGYEIVRATWRAGQPDFETWWRRSVHDGVFEPPSPSAQSTAPLAAAPASTPLSAGSTYLLVRLDPTVSDGRWATSGWLQELPKPLTKLTWDNAALIAPAMAQRLKLTNGDVVELRCAGRTVEAPVWILPGQADRCVTVHLGYGRWRAGEVANGRGFNAYLLQDPQSPWLMAGLEIHPTGKRYDLVTTQEHQSMEGRDLVRVASLETFRANPRFAADEENPESLIPDIPPQGPGRYAWAVSVDLSACTGCNACVVACQAENNIPAVGKGQVAMGRELHWIRIDRYFEGSPDDPAVLHQPVFCMHCEKAPCEIVCPVAATVHNDEGLNTMVYNRCIGTRYCSNNCPYKVRRFNFLEYSPGPDSAQAQGQNPNVTVRRRGVMEKCTYCVQRINAARIDADLGNRKIRDGEIVTACQQACPAQAIIFGDQSDPNSAVSRRKREPVNYALLAELGTRPRTTYLARIRNPGAPPEAT